MHIAENSVFIAIATMLYAFRISKPLDGRARCQDPAVEYDGFISHPRAFKCKIEPRSKEIEALVEARNSETGIKGVDSIGYRIRLMHTFLSDELRGPILWPDRETPLSEDP
ncbi:hypothetical protein B0H10DRAFT_1398184 [Mycena sp. CBHHK59/15]|nr:hypothetical protein B0H10DRAFT_1398184 [Mycena sp. CBHHK59/15]